MGSSGFVKFIFWNIVSRLSLDSLSDSNLFLWSTMDSYDYWIGPAGLK
jgi:hypothetical protein